MNDTQGIQGGKCGVLGYPLRLGWNEKLVRREPHPPGRHRNNWGRGRLRQFVAANPPLTLALSQGERGFGVLYK